MDVQLPDGTLVQGVPDGMSKADLVAKLKANGHDVSGLDAKAPSRLAQAGSDFMAGIMNPAGKNAALGAVRGAAGIGATIMQPFQAALDPAGSNQATRAGIEGGLDELGADRSSLAFKNAKLGTEIAGTAGVGGTLAAGARSLGAAPALVNALGSAGFTTGTEVAPNALAKFADMGTRMLGGAATGGVSAGLVDPNRAATGAAIGGLLPPAMKAAGAIAEPIGNALGDLAQSGSKRLMQSALKPTVAQLRTGEADTAVQTLLDYGINPTKSGVQKLRDLIDAKNAEIAHEIASSGATVDKSKVMQTLEGVRSKFSNQVSPTGDLGAIQGVADDFAAHPNLLGNDIPVQAAQSMKQGTYRVLAGKYGQMGSAETEAQKALARGLKEEIATAIPAVGPMNAEESRLLTTLSVAERRALMDANKNPMGLASLAHNPLGWAAFMADRSAAFKSLAARMVNSASAPATNALLTDASMPTAFRKLIDEMTPAVYRGVPRSGGN